MTTSTTRPITQFKSRYPRPLLVRLARTLAHRFYLIGPGLYFGAVIIRGLLVVANRGEGGLRDVESLRHIFLFAEAYEFLSPRWWVLGIFVVALFAMMILWMIADDDIHEERQEPQRAAWHTRLVAWQRNLESRQQNPPPGFVLRRTLPASSHAMPVGRDGHRMATTRGEEILIWDTNSGALAASFKRAVHETTAPMACSPDGKTIALAAYKSIELWDLTSCTLVQTLKGHTNSVLALSWAPSGSLASASYDMTARVWDTATGETTATLPLRTRFVRDLAWSPDGRRLAFAPGYPDRGIRIWELDGAQETLVVPGSAGGDFLAWSPDGRFIVSSPGDRSIGVWDAESGRLVRILEGNTEPVLNVAFSFDGRLLASVASPLYSEHEYYPQWRSYPAEIHSGTVLIWRCDTWEGVAALPIHPFDDRTYGYHLTPPLTFLPGTHHTLVTRGASSMELDIWDLNVGSIVHFAAETPFLQYSNARVVMMGESGVGKTALGLALSGDPFVPTESTHARRVWTLEEQVIQLDAHRREQREILIWDLAGQPGYRLIHQLHLTEVTVAIIVIDGRSETDPFAGVYYWDRALRQAQALQGTAALPVKKLLVAARIDRGGIGVSLDRAKQVAQELGFVDYIETSAKDGRNVRRLRQVILDSIDWDNLPKATSTELFQRIKAYLLGQKEAGRVLSTTDDLYRGFLQTLKATATPEALVEQFETCIGLVEASELILRLSFGNLILLQPELLDAYASALINAVRQEPDGLGSIAEDRVKLCDFPMPADERLADGEQEKLLLLAMIEDLVRRELAFRERTATGPYLVFPSESTRMHPDLPDPEGKMSIFRFDGPLRSIYATLAVRLSYSELFVKKDVWKDAITYSARAGGECGLALRILGEARGELTLFHDKRASKDTRFHFQEFVAAHLLRWALPNTVQRIPVFTGNGCGEPVASTTAERRRELGYDWLACPVCGMRVELDERTEPLSQLSLMDSAADGQRNLHTAAVIVQGKRAAGDFDVFLCHNNQDKAVVREIGEQLLQRGLLPWLDEWELQPGLPWQRSLEDQIEHIRAAAVFVGKSAIGPWQHMELEAFLRQFVQRNCPVIPVILPDCKSVPKLPVFLEGMTWVDLRRVEPDPMARLVWGITGERPPLPFEPQSLREVQA